MSLYTMSTYTPYVFVGGEQNINSPSSQIQMSLKQKTNETDINSSSNQIQMNSNQKTNETNINSQSILDSLSIDIMPMNIDNTDIPKFMMKRNLLGEGGFGKVNQVIVELVEKSFSDNEDFLYERNAYINLYRRVRELNPPSEYKQILYRLFVNIVFFSNRSSKIYMEELRSLDNVVSQMKSFDGNIYKQIFLTILSVNHFFNISHQDIKPKNIGVDSNGNIKLFDFGLVIQLGKYSTNRTAFYYPIHFLDADEETRNKKFIFRVKFGDIVYNASYFDLYSFGIMLYDHIFDRHPFDYDKTRYKKDDSTDRKKMIDDYKKSRVEFRETIKTSKTDPSYQDLFIALLLFEPNTLLNGENILRVFDKNPTTRFNGTIRNRSS